MSPTRIESQSRPIELDLSGAFASETGLNRAEFLFRSAGFAAHLENFVAEQEAAGVDPISPAGLLEEYKTNRRQGLLGRILNTAKNIRDAVDRVVLLASPQVIQQARALFSACCHPFHNDLSRGHRGGRPRIYFAPAAGENDLLQGLLDALHNSSHEDASFQGGNHRLTVIAVDDGTRPEMTAQLFSAFLDSLRQTAAELLEPQSAIVVASDDSPLAIVAQAEESQRLIIPKVDECRNRLLLHPGILLAASVMGMDIVKLLRGSVHAVDRFIASAPGENPTFDLAVIRQLTSDGGQCFTKVEAYVDSLRPLAECFAHSPTTHSPPSQLLLQLVSEAIRFDRLAVKLPSAKSKTGVYLNDLAVQAAQAVVESRMKLGLPTIALRIQSFDEHAIGQVLQTFALAEIVAGSLSTNSTTT